MKQAIIIHGYNDKSEFEDVSRPSPSNDHWIPWLQRQLLLNGIETQSPEMPGFYEPNYDNWKKMLEQFNPNEETILVGHSCGGGFLVRWLSETNTKVDKVVLVAPWLDPEKVIDPNFFDFVTDTNLSSKANEIITMYSTDDFSEVLDSISILQKDLPNIRYVKFTNKGHFVLNSLGSEKFPELLNIILE